VPHLPRWIPPPAPIRHAIWVAIGILVSIGVYQTLVGKFFDDEILNAPNLMSEDDPAHLHLGTLLRAGRRDRVPVGVLIAQAGRLVRVPVFLIANLGRRSRASASSSSCSPSSAGRPAHGHRAGHLRTASRAAQYGDRHSGVDPAAVGRGTGDGHDALAGFDASAIPTCVAIDFCRPAHRARVNHWNRYTRELHRGGGLGDVIAAGINKQ